MGNGDNAITKCIVIVTSTEVVHYSLHNRYFKVYTVMYYQSIDCRVLLYHQWLK